MGCRVCVASILILSFFTSVCACSSNISSEHSLPPASEAGQQDFMASPAPAQSNPSPSSATSSRKIYLYGESHGVEAIYDKEYELWHCYYTDWNMRHLFIELGYFTVEFLNIWMKADNDEILNTIYNDWQGTQNHNLYVIDFYRKIKSECPETVFHGTDIGHQYQSTGTRYLAFIEDSGLEDTEQYYLAQEAIEQGRIYYDSSDSNIKHTFRENTMAENFIREFDRLDGESVMGIYGSAHTGFGGMDYMTGTVLNMATQLQQRYGDVVNSEDLTWLAQDISPLRTDVININGTDYSALYFGEQDLTGLRDFTRREFWRLESAYDDFKEMNKTGDMLPYNNYPMPIIEGQVFVIDYYLRDGSSYRSYYRSDGNIWNGQPSTEEFSID